MTWKSHTAVTAAATYAITLDPTFAAFATIGSVLPDRIEILAPWLKHRGNSHSLALWTGLCIAAWIAGQMEPNIKLIFPVAVGGLAHILEDMLSVSGIPLWPKPNPKKTNNIVKFPLYKTGQISEYIVTATLLMICTGAIWLQKPELFPL